MLGMLSQNQLQRTATSTPVVGGVMAGRQQFGASSSHRCTGRTLCVGVVCMANPRRVARVASQMHREISDLFVNDPVLQKAISPERYLGPSDLLSAIASVTNVHVTNDLQIVKVYISVYSDPKGKERALNNLMKLQGYVRTQIGRRVRLRLTPEIRFEYDDSLEEADLIERVIGEDEVRRLRAESDVGEQQAGAPSSSAAAGSRKGTKGSDQEEEGDDAGFFDAVEEEEEEEERPNRQKDRRQYQVMRTTDVLGMPGPFDDLFSGPAGDDDHLVFTERELTTFRQQEQNWEAKQRQQQEKRKLQKGKARTAQQQKQKQQKQESLGGGGNGQ